MRYRYVTVKIGTIAQFRLVRDRRTHPLLNRDARTHLKTLSSGSLKVIACTGELNKFLFPIKTLDYEY